MSQDSQTDVGRTIKFRRMANRFTELTTTYVPFKVLNRDKLRIKRIEIKLSFLGLPTLLLRHGVE